MTRTPEVEGSRERNSAYSPDSGLRCSNARPAVVLEGRPLRIWTDYLLPRRVDTESDLNGAGDGGGAVLNPELQLLKQRHRLAAVASPAVAKTGHSIVPIKVGDVADCSVDFLVVMKSTAGSNGRVRLRKH